MIKIVESPREGMQGFSRIISTADKVRYINQLLRVGFDTVETGSFVSPRLIPQMADSLEVLRQLDLDGVKSNRMFLVVSNKGAEVISQSDEVTHISYPFSFSPTFLRLNMNTTVAESLKSVEHLINLCEKHGKQSVIYISMAYGNPYDDPWSPELLVRWVATLHAAGASTILLSNVSTEVDAATIQPIYADLISRFPEVEFGLHLHTANQGWRTKVEAAYAAGCRRFDGVINGWGGCPMAGKELLGNLKTENLMLFAEEENIPLPIDREQLLLAYRIAGEIFSPLTPYRPGE